MEAVTSKGFRGIEGRFHKEFSIHQPWSTLLELHGIRKSGCFQ